MCTVPTKYLWFSLLAHKAWRIYLSLKSGLTPAGRGYNGKLVLLRAQDGLPVTKAGTTDGGVFRGAWMNQGGDAALWTGYPKQQGEGGWAWMLGVRNVRFCSRVPLTSISASFCLEPEECKSILHPPELASRRPDILASRTLSCILPQIFP